LYRLPAKQAESDAWTISAILGPLAWCSRRSYLEEKSDGIGGVQWLSGLNMRTFL
jgi:hypothetical protein